MCILRLYNAQKLEQYKIMEMYSSYGENMINVDNKT